LGKSRLAPIRQMTIPRLELSAAVIAVRMDRMLSRELSLEIQDSVFWTDSMIVLQYIYSCSKRFQTVWRTGWLSFMMGQCRDSGGRLAQREPPLMMSPEV